MATETYQINVIFKMHEFINEKKGKIDPFG